MTLLFDADDTLWENISVFYAINERYAEWVNVDLDPDQIGRDLDPVSYTHLTLPTILRV